jgi:hypothetical protein
MRDHRRLRGVVAHGPPPFGIERPGERRCGGRFERRADRRHRLALGIIEGSAPRARAAQDGGGSRGTGRRGGIGRTQASGLPEIGQVTGKSDGVCPDIGHESDSRATAGPDRSFMHGAGDPAGAGSAAGDGRDRVAVSGSARKALTAAARDGINLRRCNNGKEVIPCLTLRWRVAQVRRSRLRSRPSGSADAAENINPNTIRVTTWTCLVRRCPRGGGGAFFCRQTSQGVRGSTLPPARRSGIVAGRSRRRDQAWPRCTAS